MWPLVPVPTARRAALSSTGSWRTFSTGSCHEPILKRVVAGYCQTGARPTPLLPVLGTNRYYRSSYINPSSTRALFFPFPLSSLFFPSSSRAHHKFCPNFVKIWRPPSIQVITKVSNFVLSSLIARLALAMLYIVINLCVLVIWEELYVVVYLIYMQFELKIILSLHICRCGLLSAFQSPS